MNSKLVAALTALNLLLLAALFALGYDLPRAYAQSRAGGKYATVTAQYTAGSDALYILHTQKQVLTVLIPETNQSGRLVLTDSRDVAADLGG